MLVGRVEARVDRGEAAILGLGGRRKAKIIRTISIGRPDDVDHN